MNNAVAEIDLQDYVASGYFVARYATDGYWRSALLPGRLISLSSCLGKTLKPNWGESLGIESFVQNLLDFGVPESQLQAFHEWSLSISAQENLTTFDQGRWLMQNIFPVDTEAVLVTLALHQELVSEFLTFKDYPEVHPGYIVYETPQHIENARRAVEDHFVKQRISLEPGGIPLGFEPIAFRNTLSHSWICSGIEKAMYELYGIRPNQHGLIDTYEEAKKVYNWIAKDELQGHRSEPEPYYPWLIVQYPVTSKAE